MAADRMGGMSPALNSRPETPYMDRSRDWADAMGRGRRLETFLYLLHGHLLERGNHGDSAAEHYLSEMRKLLGD